MEFRANHLTIGYKGNSALCSNIDIVANGGQSVALIGSNGIGKSTLLRSLAGIVAPRGGAITLDGADILKLKAHQRSRLISFVSTEAINTAYLTVSQVIALGRAPYSGWAFKLSDGDKSIIHRAMDMVGVSELSDRYIDTLSDGQRQRVMVGRAIAQDTPVILLDEPTAFLDPENREMIIKLLCQLASTTKKIVIFSTHEVDIANSHASVIWQMGDNSITIL